MALEVLFGLKAAVESTQRAKMGFESTLNG